jgi:glutamate racemase
MGSGVTLISSALEVAKIVKETIKNNDLCADGEGNPFYKFYTSDAVEKFIPMCNSILNLNGKECSFMKIDIENY